MKLLFLTFAPLESGAGHLARFRSELAYLAQIDEVSIVSLGKSPDDLKTIEKYDRVKFFHFGESLRGWNILNLRDVIEYISGIIDITHPDLVISQMEVWDVMRELGRELKGKTKFATIVHAMPFLGAPLHPSGDFSRDVIAYAHSGIAQYRREYLLAHYSEADSVFRDVAIIANNKTAAYFLRSYFPHHKAWSMIPWVPERRKDGMQTEFNERYDFAYMARMEAGKGVGYLSDILRRVSGIMARPVSLAIMGRVDDDVSRQELSDLLRVAKGEGFANIDFLGWADEDTKRDVLTRSGVFLYPSRYDNFPTVVNEALAFGLPVITWDVPFYRCCYSNTPAVIAVTPFDCASFAEAAMDALRQGPELSDAALRFIQSFDSAMAIAHADSKLFADIVHAKY